MDNPLDIDIAPEIDDAPDPPPPESTLPQWGLVRERLDWCVAFTLEHKRQRGSDAISAAAEAVAEIAASKGYGLVDGTLTVSTSRIDGDEIFVKATAKLEV